MSNRNFQRSIERALLTCRVEQQMALAERNRSELKRREKNERNCDEKGE